MGGLSIRKLSEETGLTEREVKTSISHLKTTHELTYCSRRKYTVFTVVNYDVYQSCDKRATRERHNRRMKEMSACNAITERFELIDGGFITWVLHQQNSSAFRPISSLFAVICRLFEMRMIETALSRI